MDLKFFDYIYYELIIFILTSFRNLELKISFMSIQFILSAQTCKNNYFIKYYLLFSIFIVKLKKVL